MIRNRFFAMRAGDLVCDLGFHILSFPDHAGDRSYFLPPREDRNQFHLLRKVIWSLVGFIFALLFCGLKLGPELGNHAAIFPIGLVQIVQSEYGPMGAFLAAFLQPLILSNIVSQGKTPFKEA